MPSIKGIDPQLIQTLAQQGMANRAIARELNIDAGTVRWHRRKLGLYESRDIFDGEVSIAVDPGSDVPVEDIDKRLEDEYNRKRDALEAAAQTPVNFKSDSPIAISIIGDTHVDDPGTNRVLLKEHLDIINDTPGMYAGHIGDVGNSWGQKLRRLYAEQSTSARDNIRLIEFYIKYCRKWLFIVEGNHDRWAQEYDPTRGFMPDLSSKIYRTTCSLMLQFPNGRECSLFAKHTFKGRSEWNAAHGAGKTAKLGRRYNIIAAGHIHTAALAIIKDTNVLSGLDGGMHMHALQVGTYKDIDKYAETGDFADGNITPVWTAIIDPSATEEVDFVNPHKSIRHAARTLRAMR